MRPIVRFVLPTLLLFVSVAAAQAQPGELLADRVQAVFEGQVAEAQAVGTGDTVVRVLASWAPLADVLGDAWLDAAEDALGSGHADRCAVLRALARLCMERGWPVSADNAWLAILAIDPDDREAHEALGHRRIGDEPDDALNEAVFMGWVPDDVLGRWMTPEEYAGLLQLIEERREEHRRIQADPFLRAAHTERDRLQQLSGFRGVELELLVDGRVALMHAPHGNSAAQFRECAGARLALCNSLYRGAVDRLGDAGFAPEPDRPLVVITIGEETHYLELLDAQQRGVLEIGHEPPAFYDTNNLMVIMRESADGDAALPLCMATLLLARADVTDLDTKALWFYRGLLTTIAQDDPAAIRFPTLARARGTVTGDHIEGRPDWLLADLAAVIATRDSAWQELLRHTVQAEYLASEYAGERPVPSILYSDSEVMAVAREVMMAFYLWLSERQPDALASLAERVFDGDDLMAEAVLAQLGIEPARALPDLDWLCGYHNRDLARNSQRAHDVWQRRIEILRETEGLQDLQQEFIDWLTARLDAQADDE